MDQAPDAGQWTAVASETVRTVAVLSPAAQVAAVIVLGVIVVTWIWTRRPSRTPAPGTETMTLVIGSMNESATATRDLANQVERLVEQNAALLEEVRRARLAA